MTIRALAKELNLSIGTVSKALKDSHEISQITKDRVLSGAKAFNYHPNPFASSLRRKKSNTIAVVIPDVADSFFSVAVKGIEEIAQQKGYHVLVYLTFESFLKEKHILQEVIHGRVDGVLISVSSETNSTEHIEEVDENKIPVVFFDRVIDGLNFARIMTDDFDSGYTAAQHLLDRGCKKISYLSISRDLTINNKRIQGFKKALADAGINDNDNWIVDCTNDGDENYEVVSNLLKKHDRPDGLIAGVEKLILPVYLLCQVANIRIPQDLKVLSFSNLPTAQILNPSITTITQPAFSIGESAASMLFKTLEKKNQNFRNEIVVLPSVLCERESTTMR